MRRQRPQASRAHLLLHGNVFSRAGLKRVLSCPVTVSRPLAPGLCLGRAPRRCVACVTQACDLACGSPAHLAPMFASADSPEDASPSRQRVAGGCDLH